MTMILRSIALRHGRRALAKPPQPLPASTRYFASPSQSSHDTETSDNPFEDQQYVAGAVGGTKSQAILSLPTRHNSDVDMTVADRYHAFQRHKNLTQPIGTTLAPHYQPHMLLSNPPSPSDITLELLLASQAHLGHATSLWNPANARYIYGIRQGIHIISLDVTASHLRRACSVVRGVTEKGGLILFVGTRNGQDRAVVKAAELAGACHLFDRWIPGSITNGPQILGRCGVKVVNHMDKDVPGFDSQLDTFGALKPDLVVCLNPIENWVLLHECGLNGIPTIGVIDTDADPTWVTYPIPANDDSLRTIQVIAGVLGRAGQEGQAIRKRNAELGLRPHVFDHNLQPPKENSASRGSTSTREPDLPIDTDRNLTSSTSPEDDPSNDARLLAAFEYARFADFDPEATDAALDLFDVLEPDHALSPELVELRTQLQDARRAHGLPDTANESPLTAEKIPEDLAQSLEADVGDMMDEPMTEEEAAAFHTNVVGGRGDNVYVNRSFKSAMRIAKGMADPELARLVAVKRREFGEELTDEDKKALEGHDVEVKAARARAAKWDEVQPGDEEEMRRLEREMEKGQRKSDRK